MQLQRALPTYTAVYRDSGAFVAATEEEHSLCSPGEKEADSDCQQNKKSVCLQTFSLLR